jgi:hypothetical protein
LEEVTIPHRHCLPEPPVDFSLIAAVVVVVVVVVVGRPSSIRLENTQEEVQ